MAKFCTKCGTRNDDDDIFCVGCGNQLKSVPQTQPAAPAVEIPQQKQPQAAPVPSEGASGKQNGIAVFKRRVGICILLSIVTLGIYAIYWQYLLVKNVRAIKGDDSSCTGEMLCLLFVPFYSYYWWFTRGDAVKNALLKKNHSVSGSGVIYLVLALFGLSIVAAAIMQNDFNNLPDTIEGANGEKTVLVNADTQNKKPMGSIAPAIFFLIPGIIPGLLLLIGLFISIIRSKSIEPNIIFYIILLILPISTMAVGLFIKRKSIIVVGAAALAVFNLIALLALFRFITLPYILSAYAGAVSTCILSALAAAIFACNVLLSAKKPLGKLHIIPALFQACVTVSEVVQLILLGRSVTLGVLLETLVYYVPLLVGYILAGKWLMAEEKNAAVGTEIAESNEPDENTIA